MAGTEEGVEGAVEAPRLDHIIDKAFDDYEASKEPPAPEPEPEATEEPQEPELPLEATDTGEEPVEAEPEEPAQPALQWDDGQLEGFSDEQRDAFRELDADTQTKVMEYVSARDEHYNGQLQQWENLGQQVQPLIEQVSDHVQNFRNAGLDPAQEIGAILRGNDILTNGTYAQKAAALQQLAQNIGVPVQVQEPDPFAEPGSASHEAYPHLHDLQTQRRLQEQQLVAMQRQMQQLQAQNYSNSFSQFAAAQNPDGSPKHRFAEAVRGTIDQLLQTGQARTFEDAYKLAAQPLETALASQVEQVTKSTEQQRQERVARDKKVKPVKSTGNPPRGKVVERDLTKLLDSALDEAGF